MITFSVQTNPHAGPIIVASRFAGPGYAIHEMALDETKQLTAKSLSHFFKAVTFYYSEAHTVRFFLEAELVKVTPESQFHHCVIIPTLDADILQEEHGFHWAHKITGNKTGDLISIPVSRPHYYGLDKPESFIPPSLH